MKRRDFLRRAAVCGAATVLPSSWWLASSSQAGAAQSPLDGIVVIDAHAHPDMLEPWRDRSASYAYMQCGVMSSSFSVVGDRNFLSGRGGSEYEAVKAQLAAWENGIIRERNVKKVLTTADLPKVRSEPFHPGCIFSIEGADALEGQLGRLAEFHELGVRIITLIHYRNNELGDVMRAMPERNPGLFRGGLSSFGANVIARMEQLGIVVDVAHASRATLKDILAVAKRPLIDSHTSLFQPHATYSGSRMRNWSEMEAIAKNGGVICSWPQAVPQYGRNTLADWANEIRLIKQRIGIEHIGFGTDCGGSLPRLVDGYHDERDAPKLAEAMLEVGLSPDDLAAYFGGNLLRVLKACIG